MYRKIIKPFLDFTLSALGLIVLSPVLLILIIIVKTKLGSPVFFKQERPGKDEKIFTLIKFRTMTDETDSEGNLLPDAQRLTKLGKFLRSSSLDELPELFNILKGDMSFIGPRPLSVLYLPYYTEEEHKRHKVRPGLTGLAQINGRNCLNWEERFAYDLEYINNLTFKNDLSILFKTFSKVLKKEDVVVRGTNAKVEDLDDLRAKNGNWQ